MEKLTKILILLFAITGTLLSQNDPAKPAPINERLTKENVKSVWTENEVAEIYPKPVYAKYFDKYYDLYDEHNAPLAAIIADDVVSKKVAVVINNLLSKFDYPELNVCNSTNAGNYKIVIKCSEARDPLKNYGEQAYQINFTHGKVVEIELSGVGELGKLYAAVSLVQLIRKVDNQIKIRKAEVIDYPSFSKRIFNCNPLPYHLKQDLDWMRYYKIESLAFHNVDYSWYGPDDQMKENLTAYKEWKDISGGVNALLIVNLYVGDYDIEVTNEEHQKQLKEFIEYSYKRGVTRFMINADDAPPFEYGEGYVLKSEKDKRTFSSMAEAHCWLMNDIYHWAKSKNYDLELIYCPGFYTYEEMHYGDMELFKDTPWEDDAFRPLKRDLKILGEKMNKDIEIMWTGPNVCTRKITDEDLNNWANNLQGRAPFLFDNSIFAQLEFTARSMFIAYDNDFPKNFSRKTGGNGIFINGDATGETSRAATMTANAYMWEEERYDPQLSLVDAMKRLYGSKNLNLLIKYKEVELSLCKIIKERELWYAADELWESIRKTRFITEKNPSYYHQNYGRLKALRMQLKNSVPEPEDVSEFKKKCVELSDKRNNLLKEIEKRSLKKLSYSLQSEMVELPTFDE